MLALASGFGADGARNRASGRRLGNGGSDTMLSRAALTKWWGMIGRDPGHVPFPSGQIVRWTSGTNVWLSIGGRR